MSRTMCTTSVAAYELAKKLICEYESRKQKERDMNKKPTETPEPTTAPGGVSRTVTEIDYNKHERTVKELQRQEKEEEFNRKKIEASKWCTLDHEHGPECRQPIMGCSHDHQKEWQIYEKSTDEKLKAADRFRQEGNEAYRKHNYGLAAVHYRKALLQFDYTFADGEEEEKRVDDLKLPCLLNLAACKCQQEEWDDVLTQCRLALEINPRSVKAFYRTGLAHLARDKFELAKDALLSAHEIEPNNPEVRATLRQLKQNMADYSTKRKVVAKEMLSGKQVAGEEVAAPLSSTTSFGDEAPAERRGDGGAEAVVEESSANVPPPPSSPRKEGAKPFAHRDVGDNIAEVVTDADASSAGLRRRGTAGGARENVGRESPPTDDAQDEDLEDDELSFLRAFDGRVMHWLKVAVIVLGCGAILATVVATLAPDSG
mmetsp:Transcript_71123/g.197565  ORF Transcript_71123/g.197565 Transcript_71123/m.197565 type:complete len:429 (-) Transcript_71123:67-1353(-)|eukprot:CAMPEP_0117530236 /NCGR_PEP_ID=MMETSP0784-20121206/38239_1 /TAXON_ID=39447 /ORGANISM="" /LENGTH=428 /DNA_ID=CAMNT_0005326573 /DNA_START=50 /DNA_END=1336 /DNA_ORIENTATION=-